MRKSVALVLAGIMVLALTACSSNNQDIKGTITGYVQVEEYTKPLVILEGSGKTYYLALVGDPVAYDFDHEDEELLEAIRNGEITDIKVSISEAEKGKTIEIDGNKITVWQSHQIQKTE